MRIGILTFHSQLNYGGVLQAYALQESLKLLGHSVVILDKHLGGQMSELYLGYYPHVNNLKDIILQYINRFRGINKPPYLFRRGRKTKTFFRKLQLSDISFYDWHNITAKMLDIDCIVVGSDQVWHLWAGRPEDLQVFLLKGAPEIPAISYAASIGMSSVPRLIRNDFINGLKRFKAISVREKEAVSQIEELGYAATHVVDPTLLIPPEKWHDITSWEMNKPDRLFCYFMTDNWLSVFPKLQEYAIANKCFIDVFFLEGLRQISPVNTGRKITDLYQWFKSSLTKNKKITVHWDAAPDEFLQYAARATEAVSDSFHALMFSIIFKLNVRILCPKTAKRLEMFSRIEEFTQYTTSGKLIAENLEDALRSLREDEPVIFDEKKIEKRRKFSMDWLCGQLEDIRKKNMQTDDQSK